MKRFEELQTILFLKDLIPMNKKYIFISSIVLVLVLAVIFKNSREPSKVITHSPEKTLKAKKKLVSPKKESTQKEIDAPVDDLDKAIEIQDKVDQMWSVRLFKFFRSNELGLSLEDYQKLREEYSEEYFTLMDDYHDTLAENETYNPTDDPKVVKELKLKYHEQLLQKMGKENYTKFLELRDRFNEAVFELYPGKFYIYTEF